MANTGSGVAIFGQGDVFGGKIFNVVDYTSNTTSYTQPGAGSVAGLEILSPQMFGFQNVILSILDISVDGTNTYGAEAVALNKGLTKWALQWYVVSTGAAVTAGTNISGTTVKISALGY